MIMYAERSCFSRAHLSMLRRIETLVARVSDHWGNELRCHELTRAVQVLVDEGRLRSERVVEVIDGHCGPVEHSWLWILDHGGILDVYAPGRLPAVQLVDPIVGTMYRPGPSRRDIDRSIVDELVTEMRG